MSAQTTYRFSTPVGSAGGIVDLAPYAIDTFLNEEKDGVLKFGMAVVQGTKPGEQVKVPAAGAKADKFEGIVTNNRTTELGLDGKSMVRSGVSVGVMRYGRIYARLAKDAKPNYGDPVHMIVEGEDAGCFNTSGGEAINARFLSGADNGVAVVELFNAPQPASGE